MAKFFRSLLRRWLKPFSTNATVVDSSAFHQVPDVIAPGTKSPGSPKVLSELDGPIRELYTYDESLYERARTQWQFGDWSSLVKVERESLQLHPERAKLALMVAAGHLQSGNVDAARQFIRLSQEWGCTKKLIAQILVAGVHNSLGRAAALGGQLPRAIKHFNQSIATGTPGSDLRLIGQARVSEQLAQLGLLDSTLTNEAGKRIPLSELQNVDLSKRKRIAPRKAKEKIRVIHHLACTGGTLFTKCIAAQPGVMVLNEVDPYSEVIRNDDGKSTFAPTDMLSLIRSSEAFADEKTVEEIFLNDLKILLGKLGSEKKALVLRMHSQGAYAKGDAVRPTARVGSLLEKRFEVSSVVTVRNPIDSFLSLKANEWLFFSPPSFDEYCRRYLKFMSDNSGVPLFKYEDFIAHPHQIMKSICAALDIEYSPDFADKFQIYKFSGDSGRTGNVIGPRERREYDSVFETEVNQSAAFRELAALLQYQGIDAE